MAYQSLKDKFNDFEPDDLPMAPAHNIQYDFGDDEPVTLSHDISPGWYANQPMGSQQGWQASHEGMTPFEEKMMDALPGMANSDLAQTITSITETPAGDWLFRTLDWAANKTERLIGLDYMLSHDEALREDLGLGHFALMNRLKVAGAVFDEDKKAHLSAAWNAATNFYESVGQPINGLPFYNGREGELPLPGVMLFGHWIGKELDELKPSERAFIAEQQQQEKDKIEHWRKVFSGEEIPITGGIVQLTALKEEILAGKDPEEAQAEYMESLGAVALRAQLWDAIGHAVFDPVEYVLPMLKPIERMKGVREMVRLARVAPEIADSMNDARRVIDVVGEVTQLTTKNIDELADVAKTLQVDEFSELVAQTRRAMDAGQDVSKPLDEIKAMVNRFDEIKDASYTERAIHALMGGDPLNPPKWLEKAGKTPVLGRIMRLGTLTAEARAIDYVNTMSTGIRNLFGKGDDPIQWYRSIQKAAGGAFGGQFGHSVLTPVGRHVQATLKGWLASADNSMAIWKTTEVARNQAHQISRLLGRNVVSVVTDLQKGGDEAAAILRSMQDLARQGRRSPLLTAIAEGRFAAKDLVAIGTRLSSKPGHLVPYTTDMLRGFMLSEMMDVAENLAVKQFGVTEAGLLRKATDTVKAAESVVLLGLNHMYPIQNFFNNEITMMARGVWNRMGAKQIAGVWDDFGLESARMGEAFTIAGEQLSKSGDEVFAGLTKAEVDAMKPSQIKAIREAQAAGQRVIRDTIRGDGDIFTRTTDAINKFPKGTRHVAAMIEQSARRRAMTQGLLKAWPQVYRPSRFDDVVPGLSDELRMAGIDPDALYDSVKGFRKPEDIENFRFDRALDLNPDTMARRAMDDLGIPEEQFKYFVNEEVQEDIRHILNDLPNNPAPETVHGAFDEIRETVQDQLDYWYEGNLGARVQHATNKAQTEGFDGVVDIYGELNEKLFSRMTSHQRRLDMQLDRLFELDDAGASAQAIDRGWRDIMNSGSRQWDRTFELTDRTIDAVAEGATQWGDEFKDVGATLQKSFKTLRKESQDYIGKRNDLWGDFYKKLRSGDLDRVSAQKRAMEIEAELDGLYEVLIRNTDQHWQDMDRVILRMSPNTEAFQLRRVWREMVRDGRRTDMDGVLEFRRSIQGLSKKQRRKAWHEFSLSRRQTSGDLRVIENAGRSMIAGDAEATAFFRHNLQISNEQKQAQRAFDRAEGLARRQSAIDELDALRAYEDDVLRAEPPQEILDIQSQMDALGPNGVGSPEHTQLSQALEDAQRAFYESQLGDVRTRIDELGELIPNDKQTFYMLEGKTRQEIRDTFKTALKDDTYLLPFDEMPEDVAAVMGYRLDEMAGQLGGVRGEAGTLIWGDKGAVGGFKSSYPDWYKGRNWSLPQGQGKRPLKGIDAVQEAISRLVRGDDVGDYAIYKALKNEAAEMLAKNGMDERLVDDVVRYGRESVPQPGPGRAMDPAKAQQFLANYDVLAGGKPMMVGDGLDELWFEHAGPILDGMEENIIRSANAPSKHLADLDPETQAKVGQYLNRVTGEIRDARPQAVRLAETFSDAALLNYQATRGVDMALGAMAPYGFWATHSVAAWAIESIDRPAMLATYMKASHFFDNVYGEHEKFPSRLRGRFKLELPFLPEGYGGETWVDPFRSLGLPFESFTQAYVGMQQAGQSGDAAIARKLEEMVREGQISQDEYSRALAGQNEGLYNKVEALVKQEDDGLRFDTLDFMNLSVSPHLQIQWAWNMARGTPDEIGVLPPARTAKQIGGLLGVDPGVYDSVWGNMREAIGLPAYDKWEDYRVDRELSNMAAEGRITSKEALQAMIEGEGEIYKQAQLRVGKQQGVGLVSGLFGIPTQPYPEGEQDLRAMYTDFYAAMESDDPQKQRDFFDANPEFQTRLALWKEPEEKLSQFLVDEMWDKYANLTTLDKRFVKEALGEEFQQKFLDRETRDIESIDPETLAVWVRMIGGDVPFDLGHDATPIEFADRTTAHIVEGFYNTRNNRFPPNLFDLQDAFFDEHGGKENIPWDKVPQIVKDYWNWKTDFLLKHPDAAPFIDEDFEPKTAQQQATFESFEGTGANFEFDEIRTHVMAEYGHHATRVISDFLVTGEMGPEVREILQQIADETDQPLEDVIDFYSEGAIP